MLPKIFHLTCLISLVLLVTTVDVSAERIWIEAEAADSITEPMQIKSHKSASGNKYITVLQGKNSSQRPPFDGIAKYEFQVWGGEYQVIFLTSMTVDDGDTNNHNSFWVRIKDAKTNIELPQKDKGWVNSNESDSRENWEWIWDEVHGWDGSSGQRITFNLEQGMHTLEVAYREYGFHLDAILITNELFVNQATLPKNVSERFRLGRGTFSTDPMMESMRESLNKADSLFRNNQAKQVISLIEEKLKDYSNWQKKNPEDVKRTHQGLCCELHFLLAQSQKLAKAKKADIAKSYKLSVESGMLPQVSEAKALLWLSENVSAKEYSGIVEPLIANNTDYLENVIDLVNVMQQEQKYESVISFLENNLSAYNNWLQKNPSKKVVSQDILHRVYYRLAEIKVNTNAPKKEIAEAYANTFLATINENRDQCVNAFTWLIENERAEQSIKAIKLFFKQENTNDTFLNVMTRICQGLEREKDWEKYSWFIDAVYNNTQHPEECYLDIEYSLLDKTNRWAKAFYELTDKMPEMRCKMDCRLARNHQRDGEYVEAARLYEQILNQYDLEDNKEKIEVDLFKCLFHIGDERELINKISDFVKKNKSCNKELLQEALSIQAYAHIQLEEYKEAYNVLSCILDGCSNEQEKAGVNFLVGYCYMKQNEFSKAKETFNQIIKQFPENSFSNKARLCLNQIES